MKGYWGIKVKTEDMPRSEWVSPRGTTRLRIHASIFETREEASAFLDPIVADPRNGHLIFQIAKFS